jgi:hypothetical protein
MSMLLPAVLGEAPNNGKADWMASGFAILLITAISPVALFSAIRFAHGSAGTVARDWGGIAQRTFPTRALTQRAGQLLTPLANRTAQRAAVLAKPLTARVSRLRSANEKSRSHDRIACLVAETAWRGTGNRRRIRFPGARRSYAWRDVFRCGP